MDFWQGADREAAMAAVQAARSGGIGRFVGHFPTVQTHTPMWFDVLVSPITDASGKPEKLLASSRDVTRWKRSEQLLQAIIDGTSADTGKEFFQSLVNTSPGVWASAIPSSPSACRQTGPARWPFGWEIRPDRISNMTCTALPA
jgi:hypothetical protein